MDLNAFLAEETWFSPSLQGNREVPIEEQAQLRLRPLTASELLRYRQANLAKVKTAKQEDVGAYILERDWMIKIKALEEHVVGLKNWYAVKDGVRTEITSFKELHETIMSYGNASLLDLFDEAFQALYDQSTLSEDARKNSK